MRLPASTAEVRVPERGTIIVTLNREGRLFLCSEAGNDIQEVAKEDILRAVVDWIVEHCGPVPPWDEGLPA